MQQHQATEQVQGELFNGHAHQPAAAATMDVDVGMDENLMEVQDLNDFVRILVGWHKKQVDTVQHLMNVPVGSVFQVGEDTEIVLTQEVLAGFKLGIEMTMSQLGTLPFVVDIEDSSGDEDASS